MHVCQGKTNDVPYGNSQTLLIKIYRKLATHPYDWVIPLWLCTKEASTYIRKEFCTRRIIIASLSAVWSWRQPRHPENELLDMPVFNNKKHPNYWRQYNTDEWSRGITWKARHKGIHSRGIHAHEFQEQVKLIHENKPECLATSMRLRVID